MTGELVKVILLLAAFFLLAVVCSWPDYLRQRRWLKEHPPISDEEFLSRCEPGTNPEIALKVRKIFSNASGVDEARIYPDTLISELLD